MICPHIPLPILRYIVGITEWKERKKSDHWKTHGLRSNSEPGKVSTAPWHNVRVRMIQTLHPFLQSHPCVLSEDFLSWWYMATLTHTGFGIAWSGQLVFDLLVFGMTLYKSIVPPRPNRVNILDILLRDGESYLPGTWTFFFSKGRFTLRRIHFFILIWIWIEACTG